MTSPTAFMMSRQSCLQTFSNFTLKLILPYLSLIFNLILIVFSYGLNPGNYPYLILNVVS